MAVTTIQGLVHVDCLPIVFGGAYMCQIALLLINSFGIIYPTNWQVTNEPLIGYSHTYMRSRLIPRTVNNKANTHTGGKVNRFFSPDFWDLREKYSAQATRKKADPGLKLSEKSNFKTGPRYNFQSRWKYTHTL